MNYTLWSSVDIINEPCVRTTNSTVTKPLMVVLKSFCRYLTFLKNSSGQIHPELKSQVEKLNRTLIQVLKPLVNSEMNDWDEQCEFVTHAYSSTVHASTGCSSNLLVFGEDQIMPADLVFELLG